MDRAKSGDAVSADLPASTTAPLVASRPFDVKLIVDRCSIEAYAQNGTIAMSNLVFPPSQNNKIAIFHFNRKARLGNRQNLATLLDLEVRRVYSGPLC